jgi:hypothetical protein
MEFTYAEFILPSLIIVPFVIGYTVLGWEKWYITDYPVPVRPVKRSRDFTTGPFFRDHARTNEETMNRCNKFKTVHFNVKTFELSRFAQGVHFGR